MQKFKLAWIQERLERYQIVLYFIAMMIGGMLTLVMPDTRALEVMINPALAVMLFVTFLQVPLKELFDSFRQGRFLLVLLATNFIVIPLLIAGLLAIFPLSPLLQFGVLLVLLCPCIDYVITFTHVGNGNARLLLAATPILLILQILLLPVYLSLFMGKYAVNLIPLFPFLQTFIGLIMLPLMMALVVQRWSVHQPMGKRMLNGLSVLPVPATCLVLLIVVASIIPWLGLATTQVIQVIPIYLAFAVFAPILGWLAAKLFKLPSVMCRTIAFSSSTRNSLVILPLVFAIPDGLPVLPAIIVMQTFIELISELVYMRVLPRIAA